MKLKWAWKWVRTYVWSIRGRPVPWQPWPEPLPVCCRRRICCCSAGRQMSPLHTLCSSRLRRQGSTRLSPDRAVDKRNLYSTNCTRTMGKRLIHQALFQISWKTFSCTLSRLTVAMPPGIVRACVSALRIQFSLTFHVSLLAVLAGNVKRKSRSSENILNLFLRLYFANWLPVNARICSKSRITFYTMHNYNQPRCFIISTYSWIFQL